MAEAHPPTPLLQPVVKPLSLIPVVLKEAGLDSPTFRATAVHFGEQVDIIEKWLETYIRSVGKLAQEVNALQSIVDSYLQASTPPLQLSEAVLDHDYTVLALKRFGEGAKEFWQSTLRATKKVEVTVLEPIRSFLHNDLRMLKDSRRLLDQTQKAFDGAIARYSGQARTKEPSSLREDAFQLFEARRAYLKASMDFCVMAPQVRSTLDKLLVKVITEQWRDMKSARESTTTSFAKWGADIDRVKGWSKEMEDGERVFKRELHMARQQIESNAEQSMRPSRELDDYSASTVPYLGTQGPSTNLQSPATLNTGPEKAEKQGWLFQRTITGKPARTYWVRRWFFVKNGIFGWLAQGSRSGAVEESEKIGVLLCGIRPAFQEERRFCFEVKTKDTTILLQAETQNDLTEWISSFEVAKRKALEDTAKTDSTSISHAGDAAFSISPPIAPEFAAKTGDGHGSNLSDDLSQVERSETLSVPGAEGGNLASRSSFDVTARRGTGIEGESRSRDHAARIMEKLDLTRKSTASPQMSSSSQTAAAGGIASLISASLASASHNIMPVSQMAAPAPGLPDPRLAFGQNIPTSSLAPSTLASPPAPTNLSKAAVAISGERALGLGGSGGMPGGLMANLWGSMNWGYINRLERGEVLATRHERSVSQPPSPVGRSPGLDPVDKPSDPSSQDPSPGSSTATLTGHRKTISVSGPLQSIPQRPTVVTEDFPNYYPLPLRVQDAQFRMLFPNVPRDQKVVLVFRAVWNPTEQQEFPGRVYVTTKELYFYSNYLGLVLITGISLATVDEVTAAPGKDCDFLFLHFKPGTRQDNATRITIKTFLEPLKLLQRRLNYLVRHAEDGNISLEDTLKALIRMEVGNDDHSPSAESWEDVSVTTPMDPGYGGKDVKAQLRIDGNLFGPPSAPAVRNANKFKLPSQPVVYAPQDMAQCVVDKEFNISAKSLFLVLFGDKSAVFQMLYRERRAQTVVQGPWVSVDGLQRRDIEYEVAQPGKSEVVVINDSQTIDVMTDHLCYVATDRKTPWYLPLPDWFTLLSKIVITHVAKSRCRLAIYTKVDWKNTPQLTRTIIERKALRDLQLEALDLADVIIEQVSKLGSNTRTAKVTQIFGQVGQASQASQFSVTDIPAPTKPRRFKLKPRSLSSVLLQLFGNALLSALSSLIGGIMTVLSALGNVFTAHTVLIGLLLFSGGANFFFSSRDTWVWWNERNAGKFMARLGVSPSTSMSRSIYLRDIEDGFLYTNDTALDLASIGIERDNKCHQTFTSLLISPPPSTSQPPSSRRVHRTRQHLGSYRHDLLVALRVVNRIEKEVVDAEYENWLVDEKHKCESLGKMLNDTVPKGKKGKKGKASKDGVDDWMKGYCKDCEKEVGRLKKGSRGLI